MNFANLSQLTLPPKGVSANGVESPPSMSLQSQVGHTTTRVDFFVAHVVKHSFAPLPALFAAKYQQKQ